jgi:hypothetical protein
MGWHFDLLFRTPVLQVCMVWHFHSPHLAFCAWVVKDLHGALMRLCEQPCFLKVRKELGTASWFEYQGPDQPAKFEKPGSVFNFILRHLRGEGDIDVKEDSNCIVQ